MFLGSLNNYLSIDVQYWKINVKFLLNTWYRTFSALPTEKQGKSERN